MMRAQTPKVRITAAGAVWLIDFLPRGLEVARGFGDGSPWSQRQHPDFFEVGFYSEQNGYRPRFGKF